MKPFIPYHGGKRSLAKHIVPLIEENLDKNGTYYEPFVGAGAIYLELNRPNSYIADTNPELINMWQQVKDNAEKVIFHFSKLPNTEEDYYKIRAIDRNKYYNRYSNEFKAARFIYACITGYGSVRFNSKGQMNKAYFRHPERDMLHYHDMIRDCVDLLNTTEVKLQSFEETLKLPQKGDVVYLDPPYIDTQFNQYYKKTFTMADMVELKKYCDDMDKRGVKFILSHSQNEEVKDLFKDYTVTDINVLRRLHSTIKGKEMTAPEYIITNIINV